VSAFTDDDLKGSRDITWIPYAPAAQKCGWSVHGWKMERAWSLWTSRHEASSSFASHSTPTYAHDALQLLLLRVYASVSLFSHDLRPEQAITPIRDTWMRRASQLFTASTPRLEVSCALPACYGHSRRQQRMGRRLQLLLWRHMSEASTFIDVASDEVLPQNT
jgi:hypothetical protein